MVKIKLQAGRSKLNEGRNFGLSFAFAKKIDNKAYETVQPPSTCKDYLNDVVFVEQFSPTVAAVAYGLTYNKLGIFEQDGSAFLFIQPVGFVSSGKRNEDIGFSLKEEIETINRNINKVITVLNDFEERMGFNFKSYSIPTNQDGGYILHLPSQWVENPYMISCYSLMIRIAMYADELGNPLSIILDTVSQDSSMILALKQRLQWMLKYKKVLPYTYATYPIFLEQPGRSHNYGMKSITLEDKMYMGEDNTYGNRVNSGNVVFDKPPVATPKVDKPVTSWVEPDFYVPTFINHV
jgi:hypothetical protein